MNHSTTGRVSLRRTDLPDQDKYRNDSTDHRRSHLDALRPRERTAGYRLLSILSEKTPTTPCSAALMHDNHQSITTLVLKEITSTVGDESKIYTAVDRVVTMLDLHPSFSNVDPVPALSAVWGGMALIHGEGQHGPVDVCKLVATMTESDALVRLLSDDMQMRAPVDSEGWKLVDEAGLWTTAFSLFSEATIELRRTHGEEKGLDLSSDLLRRYASVISTVVGEIEDGVYDGLPDDWIQTSVSDVIEDIKSEFEIG